MALTEAHKLRAKAKAMGIPNYRTLSHEELKKAVKTGGSNGAGSKRKSAAVVKSATKRKTASAKSAPAKSKTAKRPTTGAKRGPGRPPGSGKKTAVQTAPKRRGRPPGSKNKTTTARPVRTGPAGRNLIDRTEIDWTAEWDGAKREGSRRKIIFQALKKFKGNYDKVFDFLAPDALKLFTVSQKTGEKYTKDKALKMLRWEIGKVAFDFVLATKQHKIATNRVNSAQGDRKPARGRPGRKPAKTAAKAKTASGKRRGRPPGSKNKPKVGAARKTAASRKR